MTRDGPEAVLTPPIASWQQDGDAREWARAFLQHRAQSADPEGFVEEGNLIGWFANAMMCQADRQLRRLTGADSMNRSGLALIAAERQRHREGATDLEPRASSSRPRHSRRVNLLAKAGALIAAEIDREIRKAERDAS